MGAIFGETVTHQRWSVGVGSGRIVLGSRSDA